MQLTIEVDGSIHFEEGHHKKDTIRQNHLESFEVVVIRFSDLDVKNNLGWVIEEIKQAIVVIKPHLTSWRREKTCI